MPKEVRADRNGRPILVVQCLSCNRESQWMLPLSTGGDYRCACGRAMLVDSHVINTSVILEAQFRAQRPGLSDARS